MNISNTNKVKVNLKGGLGNYLFQIASTYSYAKEFNKTPIFETETSVTVHKNIKYYNDNILKKISLITKDNLNYKHNYIERVFHYNKIPLFNDSVKLDGYFQSEKYFEKYTSEIRELFTFNIPHIIKKYDSFIHKNKCSIHVRRGDYLKSPNHHPTQPIQYYLNAMKHFNNDTIYLIFSDDINWCKQNFPKNDKLIFIEGNKDYEDLMLMSMCQNNIICNSTFSWWAAWLNKNKNKKVVAPRRWFGSALSKNNTKDIYPKNWILL